VEVEWEVEDYNETETETEAAATATPTDEATDVRPNKYDEQAQLLDQNGTPASDVLYCIEDEDGSIILSGRTDENGLTQRIPKTDAEQSYKLYWAEDALVRLGLSKNI
jgi:hypothetical protein